MSYVGKIVRGLQHDRRQIFIAGKYASKQRWVPVELYKELKAKKKCEYCRKEFERGVRPEIHHKIPVRKGGTNERKNLMAVCHACHMKLDKTSREEWREW